MKDDKEFIDGIYKKYEEQKNNKKERKKYNIKPIVNMVAIAVIACSLIIYGKNLKEPKIISDNQPKQEETSEEISLAKVETFENFYKIVKSNTKNISKERNIAVNEEAFEDNTKSTTTESSSSKTNTQVENVDEADIVKVESNYIYYIAEDKIVIINAEKPENAEKVSEINYEEEGFYPNELYVKNNKLVVIGAYYDAVSETYKTIDEAYDRIYIRDNKTEIIIYDIAEKTNPKQIRKIEMDGNYISSRMINENLYLATTQNIYGYGIARNQMKDLNENDYKPKYKDTIISDEEKCINYDKIYYFDEIEDMNYLILAGMNIENNEEVDVQTFLGGGSDIYASEKNLYIGKNTIKYDKLYRETESITQILKFELSNGKIKYKAEAKVKGYINNQFSMDENNGYFRIATTSNIEEDKKYTTINNMYVLNENMEEVGKIEGLAKGEEIYSVRYVGNKGYMVTFKQVDPLFVIDLTNPQNPQVLGQLKIPGYSTYLHPYDDTHIIGFGYNTEQKETSVITNGLKMAMFDITDVSNPKELFKINIGKNNTSSRLTYNHKALLYSKEKNIIGFPLTTYEYGNMESKAVVYNIDLEKGFSIKGEIQTKNNSDDWEKSAERIIYVNNTYYVLSNKLIKSANMDTFEIIKEIKL
mgnify:FL=1